MLIAAPQTSLRQCPVRQLARSQICTGRQTELVGYAAARKGGGSGEQLHALVWSQHTRQSVPSGQSRPGEEQGQPLKNINYDAESDAQRLVRVKLASADQDLNQMQAVISGKHDRAYLPTLSTPGGGVPS